MSERQLTALWLAILAIAAIGFGVLGVQHLSRKRAAELAASLDAMQAAMRHDTYASYQSAIRLGERALELGPDDAATHTTLAYANAILWADHGEETEAKAKAHLAKARSASPLPPYALAADAYLRFYGGDAAGAIEELNGRFAAKDRDSKTDALLLGVLGILQGHQGDLEKAQRNLKAAQTHDPTNPRISAALGNVLRRQGNEFQAANSFESALRYEKDHPAACQGVVLMALDMAKFETARKYVEKLLHAPTLSPRQLAVAHMANAILLDALLEPTQAAQEEAAALQGRRPSADLFLLQAQRRLLANDKEAAELVVRQAALRTAEKMELESAFATLLKSPSILVRLRPDSVESPFKCVTTSRDADLRVVSTSPGHHAASVTSLALKVRGGNATLECTFEFASRSLYSEMKPLPHDELVKIVHSVGAAVPAVASHCDSLRTYSTKVSWDCFTAPSGVGSLMYGSDDCSGINFDRTVEALLIRFGFADGVQKAMEDFYSKDAKVQ